MTKIYWLNERESVVLFVAGARDFSLLAIAQTQSGTHTASHSMGTRDSSVAVNRPERDVNHLSLSRAEGQNEWSYTYVRLQCINRENYASALCKLHQAEAAIAMFFFPLLPKALLFCASCCQRNFWEACVLLAL